jgi:hypothetical protein
MPRAVFLGHDRPKVRVVRVLVPLIVVPEALSRVVWRVRQDQVDLAAVFVERHHRLKVLALDEQVLRLLVRVADMQLWLPARHARTDAP